MHYYLSLAFRSVCLCSIAHAQCSVDAVTPDEADLMHFPKTDVLSVHQSSIINFSFHRVLQIDVLEVFLPSSRAESFIMRPGDRAC